MGSPPELAVAEKAIPLLTLSMKDIAYAAILWSLEDWEPSEYIKALLDQYPRVMEVASGYPQLGEYSREEANVLQFIVSLEPDKVIDFWETLNPMFFLLFGGVSTKK